MKNGLMLLIFISLGVTLGVMLILRSDPAQPVETTFEVNDFNAAPSPDDVDRDATVADSPPLRLRFGTGNATTYPPVQDPMLSNAAK